MAALVMISSVALVGNPLEVVQAYSPHAPIVIVGNANFTVANGVTGGSGTPADPYMIDGWEIVPSVNHGIQIRNTTASFVIRDVYVHSGAPLNDGLVVENVTDGLIDNATLRDNRIGIHMDASSNLTITDGNISDNSWGIHIQASTAVIISGCRISSSNGYGIIPSGSTNVTIAGCDITGSDQHGIAVSQASNVIIASTDISGGTHSGLSLFESSNVIFANSTSSANAEYGVAGALSSNLTVSGSAISSNGAGGLDYYKSTNLTLSATAFLNNGVSLDGLPPLLSYFNSHAIDTNNTVNGLPLRYYKDCSGVTVDSLPTGQLIVANCTDFSATNLTIVNTDFGIEMAYVVGATIANSEISDNQWGIYARDSSNFTLANSGVSNNTKTGVFLNYVPQVAVADSRILDNVGAGIYGFYSPGIKVADSNVSGNGAGISIVSSPNFEVTKSMVSGSFYGFYAGWSSNVTVRNSSLSGPNYGLYTEVSTLLRITGNRVYGSPYGIYLSGSVGASVTGNELINNTIQAFDNQGSENAWDGGYPLGGNYWSDYGGVDDCSGPSQDVCPDPDGLGDTPYAIDANSQDRYPLMAPFGFPTSARIVSAALAGPAFQDLNLTWRRSGDEGHPTGTTEYRILHAAAIEGPFTQIASLGANGSLNYTFLCPGCGHVPGDTNVTFYRVQSVNPSNRTANSNVAARYARAVAVGGSLLSVPLVQADSSISRVLQTLPHGTLRVYRAEDADPWKASYSGRPGDLETLRFGEAFWVEATAGGQFTLAGLVQPGPTFPLRIGWNLVGYAAFSNETQAQSFSGLSIARVEAFDASATPYHLRIIGGSEGLVTGEAYWVLTTDVGTWIQGA